MPEPTPQPTPAPAPEPEQDLAGLEPGPGPTAEPPAPEAVAPAPEPPIPGPVPAPEPAPAPPAEPEALFDLGCRADTPGCQLAERALNTLGRPDVPPPAVRLNRPSGVYLDREYLVITAEAPSTLGGYLFIDVLTDSGDVYHLLPEPLTPANQIEPGGQVQIGVEEADRAPDVRHWQVSGPFGAGYVLATVSEQPLYQGLRPIAEPLAEYEPVLIDALANKGDNRIAIQLERVEFRPAE
jgi:hypothetical protein